MMDTARNTTDSGPAPAFFVVGTVVTAGNVVAPGVTITVVDGVVWGASILALIEDLESLAAGIATAVLLIVIPGIPLIPVPEDDDRYPPPPPLLPPDELPDDEYVVNVVTDVSKALLFAIRSSFSEFPLLKGTIWNA